MFAPKFDTSFIVKEHETFHDDGVAFEEYLVSTLQSGTKYGFGKVAPSQQPAAYDGSRIQTLIDAFADPLATHVCSYTLHSPEIASNHLATVDAGDHIHRT